MFKLHWQSGLNAACDCYTVHCLVSAELRERLLVKNTKSRYSKLRNSVYKNWEMYKLNKSMD